MVGMPTSVNGFPTAWSMAVVGGLAAFQKVTKAVEPIQQLQEVWSIRDSNWAFASYHCEIVGWNTIPYHRATPVDRVTYQSIGVMGPHLRPEAGPMVFYTFKMCIFQWLCLTTSWKLTSQTL